MHVLIITGGYLNIDFAIDYLKTLSFDKVFAVDKGLEYINQVSLVPDYIIGDFDTVSHILLKRFEDKIHANLLDSIILQYDPNKDVSDTEIAIRKAIEIGATEITLLGGTGSRLDHVLANLGLLNITDEYKIKCTIVDATNRIQLISETNHYFMITRKKQFGKYLSLIPYTIKVDGVTFKGVKYPLNDATIEKGSSFTISNEIMDDYVELQIKSGKLYLIESRDEYL